MVKVQLTGEVEIDLEKLAECFAHLDDDQQAQFFCKVAAIADKTYVGRGTMFSHGESNADWQWSKIGEHLAECECSTDRGREMLRGIVERMDRKKEEAGR